MIRRLIRALVAGLTLGLIVSAQPAAALTSGDYYVTRNVSSGRYSVTVTYGTSSANYCELVIYNDAFSLARYSPRLETAAGSALDFGPNLYLSLDEPGHWLIEPGAAVAHSYAARVQVDVSRWVGGADGHYEFWHTMHLGIYDPATYDFRERSGPPGSQNFPGC